VDGPGWSPVRGRDPLPPTDAAIIAKYDLHETERRLVAQALAATNGNVTAAAKKLGISRRTLHRKINEMNLPKTKGDRASVS
jgi:DNA-binding NtrC family response regulator